jgi:hypothetical protein
MGQRMDIPDGVRMDVLRKLAEQAMSDPDFRSVARHDLTGALAQFGYELNEQELDLVLKFRAALEESNVDLFLAERLGPEYLELLKGALN